MRSRSRSRSRSKRRKKGNGAFSLSAMIDVVFLLLMFFVATYQKQLVEAHLAIDHPLTPTKVNSILKLDAEVHPDGYHYMGQRSDLVAIEEKLANIVVRDPETQFFIKVNPSAKEGQLVRLLDICAKVNMKNLNVLTLKE